MTTKAVLRSIKNVTNGYSSIQVLVRECTSNDESSPTVSMMADIAMRTDNHVDLHDILEILDKRLNDKGKYWRHVAKALTLLDYLVRYGSEEVVFWARDNIYIIKTLREFESKDFSGHDQGSIVRVKAKELTALLMDQERLKEERLAANGSRQRGGRGRRRGNNNDDNEIYDEDLQKALEASKRTAEEEARDRVNGSSDSLERAIQLSLEEEEMRKQKNDNLFSQQTAPDVYGFYNQQQQPQQQQANGQIIGYDMFGNPVYANGDPNYYDMAALQQQQQLLAQQQAQQQAQEQAALLAAQQQAALYAAQQQALYQQQQQLYQQQMAAAQQQAQMQAAGSNNPFSRHEVPEHTGPSEEELQREQEELRQKQLLLQQQKQAAEEEAARLAALQQQEQKPLTQTLTGSQKMNEQYSDLNNLLAQGTGIDTFGNTGDARIPAQFTKTGTFINSQGTGYKQVSNNQSANPFIGTQYTGLPSSQIVPAETGFGFGNQHRQKQHQGANGNSLIDL